MEYDDQEFIFVEKYRPKTLDDCILPEAIKKTFKGFVKQGDISNLLLSGVGGCGKTAAAVALCNDLGCTYYMVNASKERGIDTLRTKITDFVTTVSLDGGSGRKVVILDEGDNLTMDTQHALRGFIESFSSNAAFILTGNYPTKLIDQLHSRLVHIPFVFSNEESPRIMAEFMKRAVEILNNEGIEYDVKVIAKLVKKQFPDFRKTLNHLHSYSVGGRIDTGILSTIDNVDIDKIFKFLKEQDFRGMREYLDVHADSIEPDNFYVDIDNNLENYVQEQSRPDAILMIEHYMVNSHFCASKKINLAAFLTDMMTNITFL
jgi:DNA polymerase III delta prime subunit